MEEALIYLDLSRSLPIYNGRQWLTAATCLDAVSHLTGD